MWSAFATYLDATTLGLLAQAQRQELWSALDERVRALDGGGVVAEFADLRTARVRYQAPGAGSTITDHLLHQAIGAIASRFAVPPAPGDVLPTAWSSDTLRDAALAAEGLTGAQWSAITAAVAGGRESWRYWNVCRRMLRRLDLVRLLPTALSVIYSGRSFSTGNTIAESADEWFGYPEGIVSSSDPVNTMTLQFDTQPGPVYTASNMFRFVCNYAVPAGLVVGGAGYALIGLISGRSDVSAELGGSWGADSWSWIAPAGSMIVGSFSNFVAEQVEMVAESAQTGTVQLSGAWRAYTDRAAYEALMAETEASGYITGTIGGLPVRNNTNVLGFRGTGVGGSINSRQLLARPAWAFEVGD